MATTGPQLHPNLEKVSFLLGTWKGSGCGQYPTIKSFNYEEEVTFSHVGRPFLVYVQKTWNAETKQPLHSEMGYLRAPQPGKLELALTQPSGTNSSVCLIDEGVISVEEGSVADDKIISLVSTKLERTPTAKHPWVHKFTRTFQYNESDKTLHYTMDMETENQPMQRHLEAKLTKQ